MLYLDESVRPIDISRSIGNTTISYLLFETDTGTIYGIKSYGEINSFIKFIDDNFELLEIISEDVFKLNIPFFKRSIDFFERELIDGETVFVNQNKHFFTKKKKSDISFKEMMNLGINRRNLLSFLNILNEPIQMYVSKFLVTENGISRDVAPTKCSVQRVLFWGGAASNVQVNKITKKGVVSSSKIPVFGLSRYSALNFTFSEEDSKKIYLDEIEIAQNGIKDRISWLSNLNLSIDSLKK